jgi:hypothetical protein
MTYSAREVLADCHVALAMLEDETDLQRWRVLWAGAVALTRAVGHVLDKVDGTDPDIKRAAGDAYRRWKGPSLQHEIFREFIDHERNNILKEYKFSHHPLHEVDMVLMQTLQYPETGQQVQLGDVVSIGDNIYRPLLDGPWEGNDARDVLSEALEWWDVELKEIEDSVRDARAGRI